MAEDVARSGGAPGELSVTFDDGLRSVGEVAAPILAELRIPWTVFVVSGWAGGREPGFGDVFLGWEELRALAAAGARVGSHSVTHRSLGGLDAEGARRELEESRREIGARVGAVVDAFAIPFGNPADWPAGCAALAREAGYEAVFGGATPLPGTVPRTFLTGHDDDRVFRAALEGAFDG